MHFFPPSELVVKHLPALLNLAVHSGLWEKECCCAVPARSLPSSDSRFLTALSHGRNRASSTWDFAQKCSLALTVRRPPRSWPPTSLPSAHTRFTLPNHQMWDVSQHRKETGKMAGIDPMQEAYDTYKAIAVPEQNWAYLSCLYPTRQEYTSCCHPAHKAMGDGI